MVVERIGEQALEEHIFRGEIFIDDDGGGGEKA